MPLPGGGELALRHVPLRPIDVPVAHHLGDAPAVDVARVAGDDVDEVGG